MIIPKIELSDLIEQFSPEKRESIFLNFKELKHSNGNISNYELFVICILTNLFTPQRVLEIGTFNGRTALNIACNLTFKGYFKTHPRVFTVDLPFKHPNPTLQIEDGTVNKGVNELGYMGLEKKIFEDYAYYSNSITQIWSDSALLIPEKFPKDVAEDFWFDFIWIDGSHSYEYVRKDAEFAFKNIRYGGLTLFHDYGGDHWLGVNQALDEIYMSLDEENKGRMFNINDTSMVVRLF